MALNEESKGQGELSQNSPTSYNGSMTWKSLFRRVSLSKKDTPMRVEGVFYKFSSFRKNNSQKNKKKNVQEIFETNSEDDTSNRPFTLNIPSIPLSVLQISELIKSDCLEEAYANLLSLRLAIQQEHEDLVQKAPSAEITNKEKDFNLLYQTLKNKLTDIIRHSCDSTSKELLVHAAFIIQEEEKREGGLGEWRNAWRAAVQEGVRDTLKGVHLDRPEENVSWLGVHLGLLGKVIVEQLEKVKTELISFYPSNFNVFETYVSSYHEAVGEHLKEFLGKVTELKDYYAMLDFLINTYHSEKIFGSPSLQPEIKEQKALKIPDDFLDQIKNQYCNCLKEVLHTSFGKIIKLEREEVWKNKVTPQRIEDGKFLTSHIHMDICEMTGTYAENSGKLDENLKNRVLCCCLEELQPFLKSFEKDFTENTSSLLDSDLLDCCLWTKYHTAYINSFRLLKEHMEAYSGSCPNEVKQIGTEVDGVILRLIEALQQQLTHEIEPFMERLMTKKWLETDEDFTEIINRIETYAGCIKFMRPPSAQIFANNVHLYVLKNYISQLMKNKYSCKGKKNAHAAVKIREQWDELRKQFDEMGSTLDGFHQLGHHLSEIIEQDNEKEIKKLLPPLVEKYPDISKKHLSAILCFRDKAVFNIEKYQIIQYFTELKRNSGRTGNAGNHEHSLFSDIK